MLESSKNSISVIVPALNEEKNILGAIDNVLSAFKEININGEIVVINDGSTDSTPQLVEKIIAENPGLIGIVHHKERKGIGASFWDGVDNANGDFVVMIPGDNENDPREILQYHELIKRVDVVIPFIFNKGVRSLFRNLLSSLYLFIINTTFLTNFNYTNGTIIYKKSILKELNNRDNSAFFQSDILVRLVKKGYLFAEVPCKLDVRKRGKSKIMNFDSFLEIAEGYLRLVRNTYFKNYSKRRRNPSSDSFAPVKNIDNTTEKIILDGHKINWHQERVRAWLRGERIAPITIDCALTCSCTYRCVYCYAKLQANEEKKMTKEVIFNFLDDAAEIGVKAVSFVSDGESTCSPHLYDAIIRGKSNGLDMALGTNGFLLKKECLEEALPALTYLRFNISAGEPERYAEIHGCDISAFHKVCDNIKESVRIKKENQLDVTIGLQMVLMPQFKDQIIPLTKLGKELGVDYLVIKHCSDDEDGSLGVDYGKYFELTETLKEAEKYSDDGYLVKAKWSKILSGGKRKYSQCFGAPFILQMSGSGLVAPCGMLFNEKYNKYHIGNITETRFKEIWQSERYWEVMNLIASDKFDARTMCGTLCLQHKVNEFLWDLKKDNISLDDYSNTNEPMHVNFI